MKKKKRKLQVSLAYIAKLKNNNNDNSTEPFAAATCPIHKEHLPAGKAPTYIPPPWFICHSQHCMTRPVTKVDPEFHLTVETGFP
jgi:hypothetical protein